MKIIILSSNVSSRTDVMPAGFQRVTDNRSLQILKGEVRYMAKRRRREGEGALNPFNNLCHERQCFLDQYGEGCKPKVHEASCTIFIAS